MNILKIGLPKGRMQRAVLDLLGGAGITLSHGPREYRPTLSIEGYDVKVLKPQNIVEMLHLGTRDLGFAGADWVAELAADLIEVLDTGLDPVKLVVAAPSAILDRGALPNRPVTIASEYERLTAERVAKLGRSDTVVRSYGATEVFPPEDADAIVDIVATGATLAANGLVIADVWMTSSTRLYASKSAWNEPAKRERIELLALLLQSVIDARKRAMVELNVPADRLEDVVRILPCMREPTVAPLHHGAGFAVKAAVPREMIPALVPAIRQAGGSDIVVSEVAQIVA